MMSNTFFRSFSLIYYTSCVFGTLPFLYNKTKRIFKLSKLYLTYTVLMIILCLVHSIITPHIIAESDNVPDKPLPRPEPASNISELITLIRNQTSAQIGMMKIINPLILNLMSLGCFSGTILHLMPKFSNFISDLNVVDKTLFPICSVNLRRDFVTSGLLFVYFLFNIIPSCGFYLISILPSSIYKFLWAVCAVHYCISIFTSEMQFLFFALMLKSRIESVNRFLSEVEKQSKIKFFKTSLFITSNVNVQNLELMRHCNRKLSDLLEVLNDIYSLHLLSIITGCFLKILFNIYLVIFSWFFSSQGTIYLINTILWGLFYFSKFIVTTLVSCIVAKEAGRTRFILSSISNRNFNVEMKEELDIFLLNTTDRNFKFTACGLLTINPKLITSAIAACTTYLVILVQFRPVA